MLVTTRNIKSYMPVTCHMNNKYVTKGAWHSGDGCDLASTLLDPSTFIGGPLTVMRVLLFVWDVSMLREYEGDGNAGVGTGEVWMR